jgi:hypothetical protein
MISFPCDHLTECKFGVDELFIINNIFIIGSYLITIYSRCFHNPQKAHKDISFFVDELTYQFFSNHS